MSPGTTGLGSLRRRQRRGGRGLADLTPLVDITLMLVVFLLLTAQTVDRGVLPVDLPAALSAEEEAGREPRVLRVTVTAAGGVLHLGRELTLEQLRDLAGAHRRAVIDADAASPHGRVVAVVDVLRQAGLEEVAYVRPCATSRALARPGGRP